ncbi:MAG: T9SS type A sorting domain-containing protein [Flavobacteriales bacterium]|nr:T9SS type A sorting domain-containing protein [Flavobacteriales bacterium]
MNGEDAFLDVAGSDTALWSRVQQLDPGVIRFPGGTVANVYHPSTPGYGLVLSEIQQFQGELASHVEDSYQVEQQKIANGSLTQNYAAQMIALANGTGVKVLYCTNILTGSVAETVQVLQLLDSAGVEVVGVELGNEAYLHDYDAVYPDVQAYINAALPYNNAIKAAYPGMKVALAAAPPVILNNEDAVQAAFVQAWNSPLSTVSWLDAAVLHAYPELSIPCAQTTVTANIACALPLAAEFAGTRMDSALAELQDVTAHDIWVTEWNVRGPYLNYGNSLIQALFCGEMFVTFARHPHVKIVTLHNFLTSDEGYNVLRKKEGEPFTPMADFRALQALASLFRGSNIDQPTTITGSSGVVAFAFAEPYQLKQDLLLVNHGGTAFSLSGLQAGASPGHAWVVGGTDASVGTTPNEMSNAAGLSLQSLDLPDIHVLYVPSYSIALVEWTSDQLYAIDELPSVAPMLITPNPAQDEVLLRYSSLRAGQVSVDVVDATGQFVASPMTGMISSGEHELVIHCEGWAPGVYMIRLSGVDGSRPLRLLKL